LRDAMMLNTVGASDDGERLARGKAMLSLLSQGVASSNPMASALTQAVAGLERYSDYYLTHEYLEAFNTPCYLVEFLSAAQDAGLVYVGDAESQSEVAALYGQNVQLNLSLTAIGQPKAMRQQFLDFAVGRSFRKSLLVPAELASFILDLPDQNRLAQLRFAGMYAHVNNAEAAAAGQTVLCNQTGGELTTNDPLVLATTEALSTAWPASVPFSDIVAAVKARCVEPISEETAHADALAAVHSLCRIGMVHLAREPLPNEAAFTEGLPSVDLAFLKVHSMRLQGRTMTGGFNLWHENVNLTLREAEMLVLPFLDGQHSLRQLRTLLCEAWTQGKVSSIDGKSLRGQRNLETAAQIALRVLLDLLRKRGVLSGGI
jgi:methyltransferase-like protein